MSEMGAQQGVVSPTLWKIPQALHMMEPLVGSLRQRGVSAVPQLEQLLGLPLRALSASCCPPWPPIALRGLLDCSAG